MASKKRKKEKDRYTLLMVPESGKPLRQYKIAAGKLRAAAAVMLVLVFALIVYVSYGITTVHRGGKAREALSLQVQQLTQENAALQEQNDGIKKQLEEKAAKTGEEQAVEGQIGEGQTGEGQAGEGQAEAQGESGEEAGTGEAKAPSGFPLNGAATVAANFGDVIENQEGEQRKRNGVAFHVESGTSIVASGDGKVVYAGEDDDKEGFLVRVDHGNGYITCYHNASPILVKEGDTVAKGAVLYTVEGDNGTLGYEIILEDEYIDPMSIMEVNG